MDFQKSRFSCLPKVAQFFRFSTFEKMMHFLRENAWYRVRQKSWKNEKRCKILFSEKWSILQLISYDFRSAKLDEFAMSVAFVQFWLTTGTSHISFNYWPFSAIGQWILKKNWVLKILKKWLFEKQSAKYLNSQFFVDKIIILWNKKTFWE